MLSLINQSLFTSGCTLAKENSGDASAKTTFPQDTREHMQTLKFTPESAIDGRGP